MEAPETEPETEPATETELATETETEPETAATHTGPAEDQAPVATARDKAIVGDSGMFEQQPTNSVGNPDEPVRTSSPPPSLQSGVPLPEDRAAGVRPGS